MNDVRALRNGAIVAFVVSLALLLVGGMFAIDRVPPIPDTVVSGGQQLSSGETILAGQSVYQRYGLMDHGSVWGHGSLRGPEFSAETLQKHPALETSPGEAVELFGLAAAFTAKTPQKRGREALGKIPRKELGAAIQRVLKRMEKYDGAIDGIIGRGSRTAISEVLPDAKGKSHRDLLAALLRKEWIDARPRLDLL